MPKKLSNNIIKEIYRLYAMGLSSLKVAKKLNISKRVVLNYVQSNGIGRNKWNCRNKHKTNLDFFDTYTTKSCYWAGFIAADGAISDQRYTINIALSSKDRNHLKAFLSTIGSRDKVKDYKVKHFHCSLACAYGKKIIDNLNHNFNITPNKSLTFQYPIQMPREFDKYFIRGYFDGDGSLYLVKGHKNGKHGQWRFSLASGSLSLLETIQYILIQKCQVKQIKIARISHTNCFQFAYNGNNQVPRIMKFLSVPFALKRKNIK